MSGKIYFLSPCDSPTMESISISITQQILRAHCLQIFPKVSAPVIGSKMEFSIILEFWLVPKDGTHGFQVSLQFWGPFFSMCFLLEFSCFAILCYFLLYRKVNLLSKYIYPLLSPQSIGSNSWFYNVGSHQLPILYIVGFIHGLLCWLSIKDPACQCRRGTFDP